MSATPPPPPGGDPNYPPQPHQPTQPAGAYPAPPQGGYPPQQGYGGGQGGGGSSGPDVGEFARRHIRTPETKEFFKTSEFGVWALTVIAVLIAGLVTDELDPFAVWTLVVVTSFAYMISRGIAKSGTKHHDPGQHRH